MLYEDLVIGPCKSEYLSQLVNLWKEYLVDQGEDPLHQYFDLKASTDGIRRILENYMKREPQGFIVATLVNEVVGFVLAFKDAFSPNYVIKGKIGHIQVVHVKREYRHKGIATRLIETALKYLKKNECSLVITETPEINVASMRLFRKFGFKLRGKLVELMKEL